MHLTWTTDTHLDSANDGARLQWLQAIQSDDGHGLLLTGDISDGMQVRADLTWLSQHYTRPVYFVLGNHDYYHRDFDSVNEEIIDLCSKIEHLIFLDHSSLIQLSNNTVLIGHTGWGDAGNGDFLNTPIRINDHRLIKDLCNLPREELQTILHARGQRAALHIQHQFDQAISTNPSTVIIATHVPPFPESAWHKGSAGAFDWIPDFTCKAIGDTILQLSDANPHIDFLVYCGHGHSPGIANLAHNLTVHTGGAEYGTPRLAGRVLYT